MKIYNFHLLTFVNVYYEDENVMFEVKNHAYFYEGFWHLQLVVPYIARHILLLMCLALHT